MYVASKGVVLMTDEHFWANGAIDSDLIVIDDPQRKVENEERADRQWHPSYPSSRRRGQTPRSSSDLIFKVSARLRLKLMGSPVELD